MALNLPVASCRCWNTTALGVDRVDRPFFQRGLERTEGQVVLVVTPQPQLGGVFHGLSISGLSYQSSG